MSYRHKGKWRDTWYETEANGQFHDLAVLPPPQDKRPRKYPMEGSVGLSARIDTFGSIRHPFILPQIEKSLVITTMWPSHYTGYIIWLHLFELCMS